MFKRHFHILASMLALVCMPAYAAEITVKPYIDGTTGNERGGLGVTLIDTTGAEVVPSTAANQTAANASLASIDGKVATAAKQPALGTAAAPSADIITVQGPVANTGALGGNLFAAGVAYNSAISSKTAGTLNNVETDSRGNIRSALVLNANAPIDTGTTVGTAYNTTSQTSTAPTSVPLGTLGYYFNGTNTFYARGNANGGLTQAYGLQASQWLYTAAAGGITNTTTAVTVKAAAGAGVKNCMVNMQFTNSTLGAGGEYVLRDGAAGTVLFRFYADVGSGKMNFGFNVPICGTANTLLEFAALTASVTGASYVNVEGFTQ